MLKLPENRMFDFSATFSNRLLSFLCPQKTISCKNKRGLKAYLDIDKVAFGIFLDAAFLRKKLLRPYNILKKTSRKCMYRLSFLYYKNMLVYLSQSLELYGT